MRALILGGPRQGEFIELAATSRTWVDLLTGDTYVVRKISWAVEDEWHPGLAAELWKLPVAVHPTLQGPMEPNLGQLALFNVVAVLHMTAFMREHAEPQTLAPVAPDSPAALIEGGDHNGELAP